MVMLTGSEWDRVIADAKAVRETALANAKQILEKAFEERLMFDEQFDKSANKQEPPEINIIVHILKR